ncbi:MAG: DUF2179 domain-containing protein [Planctomycetes bacterium]|nr:DUF2179 domain-containing protein [Planctomycetota bacterium]
MISLLAVSIFLAEMCVVTLGTLRIIFVARGRKYLAPLLGFFEILTWLFAIGQVMQNLDNAACFLAFAFGFTLGNFLGILIENKLALGMATVRVITPNDPSRLIDRLRAADFGVTCVAGQGAAGPVQIVITVVKRRQLSDVVDLIETHAPQAFYAVDELQAAAQGIFPVSKPIVGRIFPNKGIRTRLFRFFRSPGI